MCAHPASRARGPLAAVLPETPSGRSRPGVQAVAPVLDFKDALHPAGRAAQARDRVPTTPPRRSDFWPLCAHGTGPPGSIARSRALLRTCQHNQLTLSPGPHLCRLACPRAQTQAPHLRGTLFWPDETLASVGPHTPQPSRAPSSPWSCGQWSAFLKRHTGQVSSDHSPGLQRLPSPRRSPLSLRRTASHGYSCRHRLEHAALLTCSPTRAWRPAWPVRLRELSHDELDSPGSPS